MNRLIVILIFVSFSAKLQAQQTLKIEQFFSLYEYEKIDTNSFKVIYTVPNGKNLVITDINLDGYYSTERLFRNNEVIIKLNKGAWFHSCTGLSFKSGDKIMLYNENPHTSTNVSYHIIGYLIN